MPIIHNGREIDKILLNGVEHELWYNGEKFFPEDKSPFKSVTIGSQTWMSEYLAIDDGQGGIYARTVNYGIGDVVVYFYTWDAAVRVANSIDGWHLPTMNEFGTLVNTAASTTKLKSTYGWSSGNGTDDYGFAAFPAGYLMPDGGTNYNVGDDAYFWTPDKYSSVKSYISYFTNDASLHTSSRNKAYGQTVRLVKDS